MNIEHAMILNGLLLACVLIVLWYYGRERGLRHVAELQRDAWKEQYKIKSDKVARLVSEQEYMPTEEEIREIDDEELGWDASERTRAVYGYRPE